MVSQATGLLEKSFEEFFDPLQTPLVRDRAGHFNAETEGGRHALRPATVGFLLVRAIERRVDLDARKHLRVALKVAAFPRKRRCDFRGKGPAGAPHPPGGFPIPTALGHADASLSRIMASESMTAFEVVGPHDLLVVRSRIDRRLD